MPKRTNLQTKLIEWRLQLRQKELEESIENGYQILHKEEIIPIGVYLFKNLQTSGFCTFYTDLSFWNIYSEYFVEARKAAAKVKDFTRVFIIKSKSELYNNYLLQHIETDFKAGIKVYLCKYDDIPTLEAKKDFGIWDEELLCVVNYNSDNIVVDLKISKQKEDLAKAELWSLDIISVSQKVNSIDEVLFYRDHKTDEKKVLLGDRYKEFQLKSIEMQMSIAEKECSGSFVNRDSCLWYHRSWSILRALNVVSTPNWHQRFYIDTFSTYRNHQDQNILIVATADATILEHVTAGLGSLDKANIWVIDLCPTPLEICRKYAQIQNVRIHTVQIDALSLTQEGLPQNFFDIVTTDAFITRFPTFEQKQRVIEEWSKVLKKGGIVLTTCRVTGESKEVVSSAEADKFIKNTLKAFSQKLVTNPELSKYINYDLVKYCAEEYIKNIFSYPISESEVKSLFSTNGFQIVNTDKKGDLQKNAVEGEVKATSYAQVIAEKIST